MKIVVLDGFTLNPGDLSWEGLEQFGAVEVHERTPADRILERAKDAACIFTNKAPLTEETLNQLPALRFIGVLATGYNVIDIGAAKKRGITVCNVPDYSTYSVAQLCFALLLELCQHVQQHADAVKNGSWTLAPDWCFTVTPLQELYDKTIGIIGFGKIGQKVADIAGAFGMKVAAHSRTKTDQSHRQHFSWVTLPQLFEQSDVVTLHCPLTPETTGLIHKENLHRMKRSAYLLNTARGPLVVEKDLAAALNEGRIAGAGLDVLSVEPPKENNPLLEAKNCIITPHIAWATKEARRRLMDASAANLEVFLKGQPVNVVS
jgi:glycerate dehydrogenase